jgi:large subunit ribosomal protein L6
MSRIGLKPVPVPDGVDVELKGQDLTVKGKNGALSMTLVEEVVASHQGAEIVVKPRDESKRARTMWGLQRSLIDNLVTGVSKGFTINLLINGVGYRAAVDGKTLRLQLGYSHDIEYPIPEGIDIACERPTAISVSGADRQQVGQVAAEIRGYRKPEPYKGKGIRYADEVVHTKEGKKK